jgi:hypothetical protein
MANKKQRFGRPLAPRCPSSISTTEAIHRRCLNRSFDIHHRSRAKVKAARNWRLRRPMSENTGIVRSSMWSSNFSTVLVLIRPEKTRYKRRPLVRPESILSYFTPIRAAFEVEGSGGISVRQVGVICD